MIRIAQSLARAFATTALAAALAPNSAFALGKNYEVSVKGMTCKNCENAIRAALAKLPDVDSGSVKVSLKKNSAVIAMKNDAQVPRAQIEEAVKNAGYEVTAIKQIE